MMSEVIKIEVGQMAENCYLVVDTESNKAICFDPGWDGDFISEKIVEERLDLQAIYLTHGHFDHVLGCLPLKLNFGVPINLNRADLDLYKRANESALKFAGERYDPVPEIDLFLVYEQLITLGSEEIEVISLPGHTPGSLAFYNKDKWIITGDVIFEEGVGRTDFSYSNEDNLKKSIEKLIQLPDEIVVYPGHETPFLLGTFKKWWKEASF